MAMIHLRHGSPKSRDTKRFKQESQASDLANHHRRRTPCDDDGFGSIATGSSRRQVRPCLPCPDCDRFLQRSQLLRCAAKRHAHTRMNALPTGAKQDGLGAFLRMPVGHRMHHMPH
jgi:hypothetical protein